MKIGILNPNMGFLTGDRTMHKYAEIFMNKYTDKVLTYEEAKTYDGDAIVCFNGRPDLHENYPPKEFKGLKICHMMDHVFQAERTYENLKTNDIHYIMCYSRLDLFDTFFKRAYPDYIGKVISVPFGFNDKRFKNLKPFNERDNRVLALGAVNPVSDPLCLADIKVFAEHYKDQEFTHRWRRKLAIHAQDTDMQNIMRSLLPEFPRTKDFDYDIVEAYNNYQMFTTCESIMGYPSVKTYEGMACGSVFIGNDHPCYAEIGLISGKNCILHKQDDLEDFKRIVKWGQDNPEKLEQIAKNGEAFVREKYTPQKIAKNLFYNLKTCYHCQK
jgi:glycosyltransferase involved in cell wall biosynthesis